MSALVAADGDAVGVLLRGRSDDSSTERFVPQVDDPAFGCSTRRMMLMAASWPSNKLVAVTEAQLCVGC